MSINPNNLISNGDFEWWSGSSAAPDNWIVYGGATVAQESTIIKRGTYSLKITSDADGSYVGQAILNIGTLSYWQSTVITLSCWVYATDANNARIAIADGVNTYYSDYHSGGSSWEKLIVTTTLNASASAFIVYLYCDGNTKVAYFDSLVCAEGDSSFSFSQNIPFYKQGVWTPDLQFATAKVGITYSRQLGKYTKIGNIVHADFDIILTSKGSSTGVAAVYGLPFTVWKLGNNEAGGTCNNIYFLNFGAAGDDFFHRFEANTTYIALGKNSGTEIAQITDTSFANDTRLVCSGFYFTET